jgi:AcrR family transcriptional regulator
MKSKREDVLDTALALFAAHGYHAVGVDRIAQEAGVSKMTLYKYFPTKDALIESVLVQRDALFCASVERAVADADPADCLARVQAVFLWHGAWFCGGEFHGCMFIKASEEYPESGTEIRRISMLHKANMRRVLEGILVAGGIEDAGLLASHLLVVLEGMIVNANMFGDPGCVETCWHFVRELLDRRLGRTALTP